MAEIHCPMCGKPNPSELEVCKFCGARLKPLIANSPDNSQSIKPGEQPIQRPTSEFEKANSSKPGSIHPGEIPTKQNTSELESALPAWLRDLRGGKDAVEPPAEDLPAPAAQPISAAADDPALDWLKGLEKAGPEDEEVPDWLAGLREDAPAAAAKTSPAESETGGDLGSTDWMSRMGGESSPSVTGGSSAPTSEPLDFSGTSADESPDWLKSFQSPGSDSPEPAAPASPAEEENIPDWFGSLPADSFGSPLDAAPTQAEPVQPASSGNLPDWLKQLQETSAAPAAAEPTPSPVEKTSPDDLPDWLNQMQGQSNAAAKNITTPAEPIQASPAEDLPDWLNQLQGQSPLPASNQAAAEPAQPAARNDLPAWLNEMQAQAGLDEPATPQNNTPSVPDWLSGLEPSIPGSFSSPESKTPDWLSNLDGGSSDFPDEPVSESTEAAAPQSLASADMPEWLSRLQSTTVESGDVPDLPVADKAPSQAIPIKKETTPLPDWLTGIEATPGSSAGQPALIMDDSTADGGAGTAEKAFSMETPDWLSRVKPEQGSEKPTTTEGEQTAGPEIAAGALPSWVQAMRPLESVVEDANASHLNENQVTEQNGPLAGLAGVLPAGPGLGALRKPPAYSVKLQVSAVQQRYITNLEKLVSGETQSRPLKSETLKSSRLWRWLIALLLFAAIALPFVFPNIRLTPGPTLLSTDKGATFTILDALPQGAPVLVSFDYEPALSGELEAVAAPLIDQLEAKGARLTFISTSPTGPALAERFMQSTSLANSHQYKSGEDYVNLGYLSGSSAGIASFISAPASTLPFTSTGRRAWNLAPLSGVSKLSDFAVVLILTDNADTGRSWIEQSGVHMGKTPMLMVVSAQAAPMILPYYDSGQLKGLISGIPDAKNYEQKYSRPGLADHYWDSFSISALVAELLMVIGAAWSAFMVWRSRQSKPGEKA